MGGGGGGGGRMGGGGFGGMGGGMSMGSGMGMHSMGGGSNFGGMGSGLSNFSSSGRNIGSMGSQFSGRQFSGQQLSGSNSARGNFPGSSAFSGAGAKGIPSSLAGASRLSPQHASFNQSWQHGEHLSQLNSNHFDHNGQFAHDGNFNHFNNFNHWNNWNHFHNCFVVAPFWFPWWFGGFGDCFYGFGYYGYGAPYCYDTAFYPAAYDTPVEETVAYATNSADANQLPPEAPLPQNNGLNNSAGAAGASQAGAEYFAQAGDAFQTGKYRDALRLANHAAVESPQNPKAPELMSLSLFALGQYRDAAAQAHIALALGPPGDWANLYGYYSELSPYTSQLRALEKFVKDNPSAPEGHFLLAYQYLMTGYNSQAIREFREVAKLAPGDRLASELVKKYSGDTSAESIVPPAPIPSVGGGSSDNSLAKTTSEKPVPMPALTPPQQNRPAAPADDKPVPAAP